MKRQQKSSIFIDFNDGEQKTTHYFDADFLRKWINSLKIYDGSKTVELKFEHEGKICIKNINIKSELPQIKQIVKYVELCNDFIPRSAMKYLMDYTKIVSEKNLKSIKGRKYETDKIWFYLSQKNKNNVFLIGNKGVGKSRLALDIIRKIAINDCPKQFYEKRVVVLDTDYISKIKSVLIYENTINRIKLFLEKNKNDIILFFDNAVKMVFDTELFNILYMCIKKLNIPFIATLEAEDFDDYFWNVSSIAKYVNYVYLAEPDYDEIENMISQHILSLKKEYNINISDEMVKFGIYTSKLSDSIASNPENVINIFNRAFMEAKIKEKDKVDKKCILECYSTYIKEYEKKSLEEKLSTAYHEAGHYMLATMADKLKDIKISCVSILPMNFWEGVTVSYNNPNEYSIHSREYYIDYIAFLLAGSIAEKKFTGVNSVGAANDLERANIIAKAMITKYGFSKNTINLCRTYEDSYYNYLSEEKKEAIDKEIEEIIYTAKNIAEDIINKNQNLLKYIAEKLVKNDVITGKNLEKICKNFKNQITK